jgi:predicted DNA-binding transcriptional regulator YafY
MRAERMIAILLVLQARGRATAAALAVELEVSLATVRRDLEALSVAGVPVYAERGRGGGWSILGGGHLNLSGMTRSEAQALFQQLGAAAPVAPESRAALRKLLIALPASIRTASEAARGTMVVDQDRWGKQGEPLPEQLRAIREALLTHRTVEIDYVDRVGHRSSRTVDPMGLVNKGAAWYLVAETDDGRRTFRVDRVVGVSVGRAPSARPTDTDLARIWQSIVDEVEDLRADVRARIRVPNRSLIYLRRQFGRHCEVIGADDDGWVRVAVAGPSEEMLARELAGLGGDLQVIEPESLRSDLARIGRELVDRHAAPHPIAPGPAG